MKKEIKSTGPVELVEGAGSFQRGGLLRLGAILTATSAPLRTSPVKRGDWVLRRILGTPVPPPPADAGKLPADDKDFGDLSLREKLEAHKRNASCANCHVRIDPLGFPLEHYDSTGRWRENYADGKPIDDSGVLSDQTQIAGVPGLLDYLKGKEDQVRRTLATKLRRLCARPHRAGVRSTADRSHGGHRRQRHVLATGGGDRHQPAVPQSSRTRRRSRRARSQNRRGSGLKPSNGVGAR